MNLIKLYGLFRKKKALNYKISRNKYKILVNVFKNHKKMSDGELISHLQFVYNMIYPINIARDILANYSSPQHAFYYYKEGFRYLKPKEEKKERINFSFWDNILVVIGIILMSLFMTVGSVTLIISFLDFIISLFKEKVTLGLVMTSLGVLTLIVTSELQLSMYSAEKFKNLEKKK